MKTRILLLALLGLLLNSCAYKRFTSVPSEVSIDSLDVNQSLQVCEHIMDRVDKDSLSKPQVLGYWALRAQNITPEQAKEVSRVYFKYVDAVEQQKSFYIWHYTWAIADMYRLGDDEVQKALRLAYVDAVARGYKAGKGKFVDGEKLYLGYFHFGGWGAAKKFLVAPGNDKFNQSAQDYFDEEAEE